MQIILEGLGTHGPITRSASDNNPEGIENISFDALLSEKIIEKKVV
jgi:hypothetical protein